MACDAEPASADSADSVAIRRCGRDAGASRDLHRGLRSAGIRPGDRLCATAGCSARRRGGARSGSSTPRGWAAFRMSQRLFSVNQALAWAANQLRAASATPRLDAELLLGHVLGWERARVLAEGPHVLDEAQSAAFRAFIERRVALEPIAYLT